MQTPTILQPKQRTVRREKPKKQVKLSQSDAQVLQHMVREVMHVLERDREQLKVLIPVLWEGAIPDSEEGPKYFKALNTTRNVQRELKEFRKRLMKIQNTLKGIRD